MLGSLVERGSMSFQTEHGDEPDGDGGGGE